ncbi:MAG: methyl-accepting chemotaxis protein [Myxococcales bacterium]|nr:methyl-accepting chemotaxis protein [Myxococcales bacterium]
MTSAGEFGLGSETTPAIGELLESILTSAAFEDVTASEITALSDALQECLSGSLSGDATASELWERLGFRPDRARAIAQVLVETGVAGGEQGDDAVDPASAGASPTADVPKKTANDNAREGRTTHKRNKSGRKEMAKRSKTAASAAEEASDSQTTLDQMEAFFDVIEAPVIIADEDQTIVHINRAGLDLLEPVSDELEQLCGLSLGSLIGAALYDLMGGHTVGKRRLKSLPKRTCEAAMVLGGRKVTVKVNAFEAPFWSFSGALATLSSEEDDTPQEGTQKVAGRGATVQLAASAEELLSVSHRLASTAEETSSQAQIVSAASEEVSQNLQTVAGGMEELSHSISEIARSASKASTVAATGVELAETTNHTVAKLGDSSSEIGKVIKVITTIAQQTNLLALNATIEAARAGEAGKGFAVVANEVKELAKETATASEDISRKVEAIQTGTSDAVAAISEINNIVNQINEIQLNIAAAVEQQTATAGEIGRNIGGAARGSSEITDNISAVAAAARSTSEGAMDTKRAAEDLNRLASQWGGK